MSGKTLNEIVALWLDVARGIVALQKLADESGEPRGQHSLELQAESWFGWNRN